MDIENVIKLMKAAQDTDFDHFEIVEDDFAMKLERNKPAQAVYAAPPQAVIPVQEPAAAAPEQAELQAPAHREETKQSTPEGRDIVSELVGVFHSPPNKEAVKIGDKLKKGEVVCMVEAMKLMNEIDMPEDGEIVWVAANEGDTVEYGQLLFRYI